MNINIEEAAQEFKNFLEIPIYGKALYLKMLEYKDAIAANIEEFKNLEKLRSLVKKNEKNFQKSANDLNFEIVKTRGIWMPVIKGKNDCEPSRIIPHELVNFIVKEAEGIDFKIIHRKSNLRIPGLEGKVFNIWFEQLRDDYIYGILKDPKIEPKRTFEPNLMNMRDELKKIDYEEMFEIFRLMFDDEDFRKEIKKAYQLWKTLDLKVL